MSKGHIARASDWCALQGALYKCINTIQYNVRIGYRPGMAQEKPGHPRPHLIKGLGITKLFTEMRKCGIVEFFTEM